MFFNLFYQMVPGVYVSQWECAFEQSTVYTICIIQRLLPVARGNPIISLHYRERGEQAKSQILRPQNDT